MNKVWQIMTDPESGKMCFFNNISKQKKFEKPFGLKLSETEQEMWDTA